MAAKRRLFCPCGSDQLQYLRGLDMRICSYVSTITCYACGGETVYTEKPITQQQAMRALKANLKKLESGPKK